MEIEEKQLVSNILVDLGEITVRPLLTPKPTNFAEEKEKFIKNNQYNPIFVYHPPKDLIAERSKLEDIVKTIYSYKFNKSLEDYLITVSNYILNICILNEYLGNDQKFNEYLRKVYDWNFELHQNFDEIMVSLPIDSGQELNVKVIENEVKKVLNAYGLNEWRTVVKEERNSVSIDTDLKSIFIGANIAKSPTGLKKLIAHEIDTHVLRFTNSIKSGYRIIELGNFPLKIPTEEGFAIYNEFQNRVLTRGDLQNYLNRFILCQKEGASFSDLYNICIQELGYEESRAFETTYRLKRGFVNTSKGFIHLKDSAYLKGFDILLKSIETRKDHTFLFNGRITLNEKILLDYDIFNYKSDLPNWFENLSID